VSTHRKFAKASQENDNLDVSRLQHLVGEEDGSPLPDKELILVEVEGQLIQTKFKNEQDKSVYQIVVLTQDLAMIFGKSENLLV